MNIYSGDMQYALARDRMSRLRDDAERARLARSLRGQEPRLTGRLATSVGRGLASVAQSMRRDRRPILPAI